MPRTFYLRLGKEVSGPATAQQLREMVANGTLRKTDYVRAADHDKWYVAGAVKGLFTDKVQSADPTRPQPPAPRNHSARPTDHTTEGMFDMGGFERDRERRLGARRKRLLLWAGATAGVAIISLVVALPLIPSAGGPENATGIGWSLADVQRKWGDEEGWDWYHAEPALSGEPGVIDYRARHVEGRTEQIQVVGTPDDLRSFLVVSSIEPFEDASDPEKLGAWSLRASAMAAEVAGADSDDVAKWFVNVFSRFLNRVVDHHELTRVESRTFGRVTLQVTFGGLKTGFMSTVGVVPADEPSNAETASVQQEQGSERALPQGVFDRALGIGDSALPESTRDRWLAENNSSRDHWNRMMGMGGEMINLNYEVTRQRLPYFIASGASHIKVADSYPYEMEWRLVGVGGDGANDVPVSFLKTRHDGPFTHEMAIAVVKEFRRISQGDIDTFRVTAAMKNAEASFKRIRRLKPSDLGSWFTASKLPEQASRENPIGEYAIRVVIREWQREEYTLEDGASQILIYFVYMPPRRKVDLTKVHGGGFSTILNSPDWW